MIGRGLVKVSRINTKYNLRLYKTSLRNSNTSAIIKYKRYRNMPRRCINEAETAYYEYIISRHQIIILQYVETLRCHYKNNNKKSHRCHENILLCDGKFSTDNKHITDSMNTYFCKKGSHLQQLMLNCGTEYNRYLPNRVNNTFFLTPVNENESLNEIKMLNPKNLLVPTMLVLD